MLELYLSVRHPIGALVNSYVMAMIRSQAADSPEIPVPTMATLRRGAFTFMAPIPRARARGARRRRRNFFLRILQRNCYRNWCEFSGESQGRPSP